MNSRNFNEGEIFKSATPSQKILWNYIFFRHGENIAVSQLFYQGLISASEFFTYVPRRLYFGIEATWTVSTYVSAVPGIIYLHDVNNVQNLPLCNNVIVWNTISSSVNYSPQTITSHNVIFSRIVPTNYDRVSFKGYRLTF